eukprot:6944402-Pyramimonas_sp.AAC.1
MEGYLRSESDAIIAIRYLKDALKANMALCLDFEWDAHNHSLPLQLVQVAVGGCGPYVFDTQHVRNLLRLESFGSLLGRSAPIKVLHDARADTVTLKSNLSADFAFAPLFDTQVAHRVLTGEFNDARGLDYVLKHWLGVHIEKKSALVKTFMRTPGAWAKRPLPQEMIIYAADDVRHLAKLYEAMRAKA